MSPNPVEAVEDDVAAAVPKSKRMTNEASLKRRAKAQQSDDPHAAEIEMLSAGKGPGSRRTSANSQHSSRRPSTNSQNSASISVASDTPMDGGRESGRASVMSHRSQDKPVEGDIMEQHDRFLVDQEEGPGIAEISRKGRKKSSVVVHETSYIPLEVAEAQVSKLVSEMEKMKTEHLEMIEQMDENYTQIVIDTEEYYVEQIRKLRNKFASDSGQGGDVLVDEERYEREIQALVKKNKELEAIVAAGGGKAALSRTTSSSSVKSDSALNEKDEDSGSDKGGGDDDDDDVSDESASVGDSDEDEKPSEAGEDGAEGGEGGGAAIAAAAAAGAAGGAASSALVKRLEKTITLKDKKIATLKKKLAQANTVAAGDGGGGGGGGRGAAAAAGGGASTAEMVKLKKEMAVIKKKQKEANDAVERKERKIEELKASLETTTTQLRESEDNFKKFKQDSKTGAAELDGLRKKAEELETAKAELKESVARVHELDGELKKVAELYKKEQVLRKKYYNTIEDMKGKIRVYARCRPMSRREIEEEKSYVCVTFPDEYTITVQRDSKESQFMFDQCFGPDSTQEQVFEDTRFLVQSAYDGYNVCIFAYGQTGSGKTFTMHGNKELPGLTPRCISELFQTIHDNAKTFECEISCYMLELYNDQLIDLLASPPNKDNLDIKTNDKGMVYVRNAVVKGCESGADVQKWLEFGSGQRHVASTQMNAESSRSHLIFSVIINTMDKKTKKRATGKLSLVDLAGSERVGKTNATASQLREAQSINKSLTALGDVISALSTEESFVPYRNNKLTQLMRDSLGGNAKTLMFVNVSPAHFNADETHTSLVYASRVKLITNNAKKNEESAEIQRLKRIIAKLRSGQTVDEKELAEPVEEGEED